MPINSAPNPIKTFGSIAAAGGLLAGGANIASAVKAGTGAYNVTFVTPMKNNLYLVIVTPINGGINIGCAHSKTTAGFSISSFRETAGTMSAIDSIFDFLVIE